MPDAVPPLEVLYHAGACLVVNKPSGILTQSPPGIESLENRVRDYFREQESKPPDTNIYTGVPHRLDRPASGAIVFGRHVRATRRLADQFERRTVEKTYWALVPAGDLPEAPTWHDHLRKIPSRACVEVVEAGHPDGKSAVLHFLQRQTIGDFMLLEIQLETGRMHQIRVQAASRGFPIVGDAQYGSHVQFGREFGDDPRGRAIALHARSLTFDHPQTKERVAVTAPISAAWRDFGVSE